jgi:hypothetical protein
MIVFDLPTLLAVTVFISGLAGCLLLLSRLQHRRIFALALWGSAFIIAAIATVLIVVVRNTVPDFWSIVIGNAILAAAYGLIWSGARNFEGKRVSIVPTLAGSLIWLSACSIGPIYAAPEARASVMAAIAIVYALLTVRELWRGRGTAYGVGRSCCCSSRTQPLFRSVFRLSARWSLPIPSIRNC